MTDADTLRDELAEALFVIIQEAHGAKADPGKSRQQARIAVDAVVPKALAYADAQVAAERARIAADLVALRDRVSIWYRAVVDEAIYIARKRP